MAAQIDAAPDQTGRRSRALILLVGAFAIPAADAGDNGSVTYGDGFNLPATTDVGRAYDGTDPAA